MTSARLPWPWPRARLRIRAVDPPHATASLDVTDVSFGDGWLACTYNAAEWGSPAPIRMVVPEWRVVEVVSVDDAGRPTA